MRVIADFHIHSKFSRATSPNMVLDQIAKWAQWKGINVVGTGDFTHPLWFSEIKSKLKPSGNGLFYYPDYPEIKFILTVEISSIYSQDNQVRKVHNVIFAPDIESAEKINLKLNQIGNLHSDGRPILGISSYNLLKLILDINPACLMIPAHAWTPWFSIFGSKSGFDTIAECFGNLSDKIYAIETGLSSDPEMNWRLSQLDSIALISCSDAHNPTNLGREATVFELQNGDELSYGLISQMIKEANSKYRLKHPEYINESYLDYTIEFFPEEGKYHLDGHRVCNATCLTPSESKKNNDLCPVCKKPLTIGVMHRVDDLADRAENFIPSKAPSSKHIVPLQEIIAESLGVNKTSIRVQEEYQKMIQTFGNEFKILLDEKIETLKKYNAKIAQGIGAMREGHVTKIGGYDGVYGIIKVINENEKEKNGPEQTKLF